MSWVPQLFVNIPKVTDESIAKSQWHIPLIYSESSAAITVRCVKCVIYRFCTVFSAVVEASFSAIVAITTAQSLTSSDLCRYSLALLDDWAISRLFLTASVRSLEAAIDLRATAMDGPQHSGAMKRQWQIEKSLRKACSRLSCHDIFL